MDNETRLGAHDAQTPTTICTCIESGGLELQVLLLVESLRKYGGKWADTPVYAIKPRRGPALNRKTLARLAELGVIFVDKRLNDRVPWWNHANKPAAMRHVEQVATTPFVTWMDSDMMFLRQPEDFCPVPGKDFKARAGEAVDVASNGSDEKAEYWHKLCTIFGLSFDEFETITSFPDHKEIKAYWQAGIYTYQREAALGAKHYDIITQMLKLPIASKSAGTYHQDQVSLALSVQALKLKADQFHPRMNFNFNMLDKASAKLLPIEEVCVLHYHGSFWPEAFHDSARPELVKVLETDQMALIDHYIPLHNGSPRARIEHKFYKKLRDRKVKAFEASVVKY